MRRLRFISVAVVVIFTAGCATTDDEATERGFTRTSLLVEAMDEAVAEENVPRTVNLLTYGRERSLLSEEQQRLYVERVLDIERNAYRAAVNRRDYEVATTHASNLYSLAEDPYELGHSPTVDSVRSRDELLLARADAAVESGDSVLGLYLALRRSTLGDLSEAQLRRYAEIARGLNHDEALARLLQIAERAQLQFPAPDNETENPSDSTAQMLSGTVTVWVNRGIRIQQGVGVPDRVIGSGFFVDPRGYVLTNYHVVASEVDPEYEGFSRLFIKLPDRPDERVPARVVGYDRIFDLALLKVEIDPQYVFSLSDTRELEPGERVFALGSPGGLDSTVTSGIVSAAGRRFLQMGEAVQVDVPINPGNSGGPLVLPDGQVAGVVFAGIEQFEGVNFAIPSYWIRHFFPRLYHGEVTHAWFGASVHQTGEGLEVVYVAQDSPADVVGVSVGDVLLEINGVRVEDIAAAQDQMLSLSPGEFARTLWMRSDSDGREQTIHRLVASDSRPFSPVEQALDRQPIEDLFPVLYGMYVDQVSGAPWGPDFVITDVLPGSVADESSLSADDPFALRNWRVDEDLRAAFIQIVIQRRKAGFIESGVQLGAFLETDSFL